MEYRELKAEEYPLMQEAYRGPCPAPSPFTTVAAAFDEDFLAAFWVFGPQYHAEPVWVDSDYTGMIFLPLLRSQIENKLKEGTEYYLFTASEQTEKLAAAMDYEAMPWKVWRRRSECHS